MTTTKTIRRLMIISLGFLITIGLLNSVAADSPSYPDITYPLAITDAFYSDLDNDGHEDDITVEFELYSPTGELCYFEGDFTAYLVLPSGFTYVIKFRIVKVFEELSVTLELYNTATEDGWYDVYLFADVFGFDINGIVFYGTVTDSLTFDPPEFQDGAVPYSIVYYR